MIEASSLCAPRRECSDSVHMLFRMVQGVGGMSRIVVREPHFHPPLKRVCMLMLHKTALLRV